MSADDDETRPESELERLLPRREFLKLTGAVLIAAPACSDDQAGATASPDGSSGGAGSSGSTGAPGSTSSGELPTTGGPTTGGPTTGEGTSTGASTGEGTSTGEQPADMGAQPAECEGEEIVFAPDAVPEDLQRFPLAVIAGAVRPESVLLHSFSEAPGPVLLRVWQPGEAEGTVRIVKELEVVADELGFLRAPVSGLCPGQWYRYGFFAAEGGEPVARGVLGEFRTALADESSEPVTVAISACNHHNHTPWPALQTTSDEYYDLFLHLGDMVYNDAKMTIADMRANWKEYLRVDQGGQSGGFALAYARAGLYCTLDDHEVTNDFNPETVDPMRFQDAMTAMFEAVPVTDTPDGFRVWQSFRWGKTVEFIVLDCRTERKPSTMNSPQAQYLSPEQMAWLKERLTASPCHFKCVLNSVPITNMPTVPWDFLTVDRWEGYPAQRDELLDFIAGEDIRNVWFVAGDFHTCFVSQVEPGGAGVLARTREVAVTGGNTNVLGDFLAKPQFDFGTSQPHACLLTFDPAADEVLVRFLDPGSGQDVYAKVLSQK